MQRSSRFIFWLVILCFLISGMAGLIYQLAWMRYLSLFLGHTSYAVVAVLIAFMGGAGHRQRRFRHLGRQDGSPARFLWLA